jgi:hypothetical protein
LSAFVKARLSKAKGWQGQQVAVGSVVWAL